MKRIAVILFLLLAAGVFTINALDFTYAVIGAEVAVSLPGACWAGVTVNGVLDETQITDIGYEITGHSFLYLDAFIYGKFPITL